MGDNWRHSFEQFRDSSYNYNNMIMQDNSGFPFVSNFHQNINGKKESVFLRLLCFIHDGIQRIKIRFNLGAKIWKF